jgi:hypothetical protein
MSIGFLRAVMLGAAALAATPAAALEDLTGGWEGTLVCDFTDDTGRTARERRTT